jgi:hypothetical protein
MHLIPSGDELKNSYEYNNSLDDLFRRMTKENLSWDELLVGKSYNAYDATTTHSTSIGGSKSARRKLPDVGFLGALAQFRGNHAGVLKGLDFDSSATISSPINVYPAKFEDGDSRIAGAITTARFFQRYTNTALNKNRRRAATIFRIFLGKSMIPAIEGGKDEIHALVDLAFAKKFEVTVEDVQSTMQRNVHGKRKDCFACHQMLDPLGRAFQSSGVVLGDRPSAGAIVLPVRKFIQSGNGIGDLAKIITQQPEYETTQVRLFWKWYIGEDIPLAGDRLKEVVSAFNTVGRKTNDFVSYLLWQPEFTDPYKYRPQGWPAKVMSIKALFENSCTDCHQTGVGPDINFTKWPIGGDKANEMTAKVYFKVFIEKTMPKGTKLSAEQSDLLKSWIESGAQDENKTPTIDSVRFKEELDKLTGGNP